MRRSQPYILFVFVFILHFLFATVETSTTLFTSSAAANNGEPSSTSLISSTAVSSGSTAVVTSSSIATTAPTTTPTSSTKGTEFWDKAIDLATPFGTFIIVLAAVALMLIFLIACICISCKYTKLKKKTDLNFPGRGMAINDSDWIRSNDDLLMWERNLRASEVKTSNGISNRPYNDKRA
ncbi:uncharacterized protein LOC111321390 isoform X2 [Stylophora pistillata]|uniref:Uncharacterized protein n=1 Tax=Stylophora pistillata TaxID=50429 RepID=A0A2B4SMS9_STYPI|nr:uncharacterized protein LOC111321390 isoform X2 [Stylophora pistillata]PFX31994.1 hypothetical protein AWC38_SpisGene25810 [Stylophora pistillata]